MNRTTAVKLILNLMSESKACCLTTIDTDGFPETRAMLNLRNREMYPLLVPFFEKHHSDFLVYFTTNTSSGKMSQIRKNPNVCVYYSIPDEWRGLMLGGKIEVVDDIKIKQMLWQKEWTMYYPGGPTDPDCAFLCLKPAVFKLYHQMERFILTQGEAS